MKIRMIIVAMLLMALAFSCGGNGATTSSEKIEKEMMAEHDRIMPKMQELNELYTEMRQYLFLDTTMTVETRDRLSMVTANLKEAEEGMMNWMNGISDLELNKVSMKPEDLEKYLSARKGEILQIGQLTDQTIEEAKKALANRKQQ